MVKKLLKSLLILFIVLVSCAFLFILTLQIFEYRPKEITPLEINDNVTDDETLYVQMSDIIDVLTFNIGYASLSETEDFVMDGGKKARMDDDEGVVANLVGIESILSEADADIYLLQEVDVDSSRSYHINQYAQLANLIQMPVTLGYNYRCIFVPFPLNPSQMMGEVNSGVMSATRFYVESSNRHQLPGEFSWPLRLANLKRCMVVNRLPIAGSEKKLIVINVHLSAYDDGSMRLQEMAALQTLIQTEYDLGNYVLVGGDFNQTFPGSYTQTDGTYDYLYELKDPTYWQAYGMDNTWFSEHLWQMVADNTTPTCRLLHQPYDTVNLENNQYYVIDGFIVSPNIQVLTVTTLSENFKYSDHNPVKLQIRLIP